MLVEAITVHQPSCIQHYHERKSDHQTERCRGLLAIVRWVSGITYDARYVNNQTGLSSPKSGAGVAHRGVVSDIFKTGPSVSIWP